VELLSAPGGHEALAGSGSHDHLSPETTLRHKRSCRKFQRPQHRINGFSLVGAEFLHWHSDLPSLALRIRRSSAKPAGLPRVRGLR
jgi:hypothetical protein